MKQIEDFIMDPFQMMSIIQTCNDEGIINQICYIKEELLIKLKLPPM